MKKHTKSQNEQILAMLKRGEVTPMLALKAVGCFRLGARIYDLKQQGHRIVTRTVSRDGKHFAAYRLA